MPSLFIKKQSAHTLEITKSKAKALLELVFYIVFFVVWYSFLIPDDRGDTFWLTALINEVKQNWVLLLFIVAPVFAISTMLEDYNTLTKGANYTFHKTKGIQFNKRQLAASADLLNVQVRAYTDSDNDTFYRLSLILKNGKHSLDSGSNRNRALDIAEAIAEHMGVEIIYK